MVQWTKALDALLGVVTDIRLGTMIGCSDQTVHRRRQRLEVAAYRPERNWTPGMDRLLRLPTAVVARRLGVSEGAVRVRRHRLGLSAGRGRKPAR
jgi:hypothetical protein